MSGCYFFCGLLYRDGPAVQCACRHATILVSPTICKLLFISDPTENRRVMLRVYTWILLFFFAPVLFSYPVRMQR